MSFDHILTHTKSSLFFAFGLHFLCQIWYGVFFALLNMTYCLPYLVLYVRHIWYGMFSAMLCNSSNKSFVTNSSNKSFVTSSDYNTGLLAYDAALLGYMISTFQTTISPSSSRVQGPWRIPQRVKQQEHIHNVWQMTAGQQTQPANRKMLILLCCSPILQHLLGMLLQQQLFSNTFWHFPLCHQDRPK